MDPARIGTVLARFRIAPARFGGSVARFIAVPVQICSAFARIGTVPTRFRTAVARILRKSSPVSKHFPLESVRFPLNFAVPSLDSVRFPLDYTLLPPDSVRLSLEFGLFPLGFAAHPPNSTQPPLNSTLPWSDFSTTLFISNCQTNIHKFSHIIVEPIPAIYPFKTSINRLNACIPASVCLNTPASSRTLANFLPSSFCKIVSTFSASVCSPYASFICSAHSW